MFTLILQSMLQDSSRWADVGKNLIDETPFVWPVLTNETAQDELCANCEEYFFT